MAVNRFLTGLERVGYEVFGRFVEQAVTGSQRNFWNKRIDPVNREIQSVA